MTTRLIIMMLMTITTIINTVIWLKKYDYGSSDDDGNDDGDEDNEDDDDGDDDSDEYDDNVIKKYDYIISVMIMTMVKIMLMNMIVTEK